MIIQWLLANTQNKHVDMFYVDQKSNMASTAGQSFNIGPFEKLYMNDHCKGGNFRVMVLHLSTTFQLYNIMVVRVLFFCTPRKLMTCRNFKYIENLK